MDHTLFNCIIPRRLDYLVSQLPKDWSSSGFVQLNVSHKQIMFRIDERPYNLVGINSADLLLLSFYNPLLLWSSIIVLRQKPEPLTRGLCVLGDINFFEVNGRGPKLTLGPGELNPRVWALQVLGNPCPQGPQIWPDLCYGFRRFLRFAPWEKFLYNNLSQIIA